MANMEPPMLSSQDHTILLTLWKLRGVGRNAVGLEALKAELPSEAISDGFPQTVERLQKQGFLEATNVQGQNMLSLTSLGLAILRQIQEDKLEEI